MKLRATHPWAHQFRRFCDRTQSPISSLERDESKRVVRVEASGVEREWSKGVVEGEWLKREWLKGVGQGSGTSEFDKRA